jgi:hypothetical protein
LKGIAVASSVIAELLELLGQEQACYTSLLDLSRRQRSVIEEHDVDRLLVLLGQKQQILTRVAGIEEQLRPYKERWKSLHESLDADDRQVLDLALSTVGELLSELIELEKASEQLLKGHRDRTLDELAATTHGTTVHQTYASGTAEVPPRFLDVRTE